MTTWAAWGLEEEEELRPPLTDRPTDPRQRPFSLTHSLTQGADSRNCGLRLFGRRGRWMEGLLLRLVLLLRGSLLLLLPLLLLPGRASENRLSMPTSLQLNQSLVLLLVTYVVFVRRAAVCLLPSPLLLFNCCLSSSSLLPPPPPPPITLVRPRPSARPSVGRSGHRLFAVRGAAAAQETYPKCCPPPPPPARNPHSAQPQ